MTINFPLVLVLLTLLCGAIGLIDILFFAAKRKETNQKMPVLVDYAKSFFPVFLIVLLIRSFVVQPFRVPSGSLKPTILTNDFVLVNQFAYGFRLPVLNKKVVSMGEPKAGDIAVFRFPGNPKVDYIKRVIGVPGDHIVYKNKQLTINGQKVSQTFVKNTIDHEPGASNLPVKVYEENLEGVKHQIYVYPTGGATVDYNVVVPKGYYFMMGDNRDASADSRFWGFVPENNLIGKAVFVWFSWDSRRDRVRWSHLGFIK